MSTDTYEVSQGMIADFDANGSAKVTGTLDTSRPITVDNNWRDSAHIALANYDKVAEKYATTYLSLPTLKTTTNNLIPTQKVGVFFHNEYVTSTVVEVSEIKPFVVDFTDKPLVIIKYENGKWDYA